MSSPIIASVRRLGLTDTHTHAPSLRYLDRHLLQLFAPKRKQRGFFSRLWGGDDDGTTAMKQPEFCARLREIAWVPVATQPPVQLLPWDDERHKTPLARPGEVRPLDECWLVSASLRLLHGPQVRYPALGLSCFHAPSALS